MQEDLRVMRPRMPHGGIRMRPRYVVPMQRQGADVPIVPDDPVAADIAMPIPVAQWPNDDDVANDDDDVASDDDASDDDANDDDASDDDASDDEVSKIDQPDQPINEETLTNLKRPVKMLMWREEYGLPIEFRPVTDTLRIGRDNKPLIIGNEDVTQWSWNVSFVRDNMLDYPDTLIFARPMINAYDTKGFSSAGLNTIMKQIAFAGICVIYASNYVRPRGLISEKIRGYSAVLGMPCDIPNSHRIYEVLLKHLPQSMQKCASTKAVMTMVAKDSPPGSYMTMEDNIIDDVYETISYRDVATVKRRLFGIPKVGVIEAAGWKLQIIKEIPEAHERYKEKMKLLNKLPRGDARHIQMEFD